MAARRPAGYVRFVVERPCSNCHPEHPGQMTDWRTAQYGGLKTCHRCRGSGLETSTMEVDEMRALPKEGKRMDYDTLHSVRWMRARLEDGHLSGPQLAAAYQDAHGIAADHWTDLIKDAQTARLMKGRE